MNKYKIIYADPPWNFRVWSDKGKGRSAENHYPVMNLEDIQTLDIQSISENNCTLFLWATMPLLPQALETINAWGFKYKTVAFTWVKTNKKSPGLFTGLGYTTRSNCELCLLATKGKTLQRVSKSVHSVIMSPVGEHSAKPPETRDRIVSLFGDISRIELFARERCEGWDCIGYDIDGKDIRNILGPKLKSQLMIDKEEFF